VVRGEVDEIARGEITRLDCTIMCLLITGSLY